MNFRIRASGLSDLGLSRSVNEDSFAIDPDQGLYLVADGMGGHGHGDVASRIAVQAVCDSLVGDRGGWRALSWRSAGGGARLFDRLRKAIGTANERVLKAVENDEALTGMGTTVVALMTDNGRAAIAHVGDSRAYRLREGRFELLTADHTWVAEQVSAGNISESQARVHPFKSVVTRALGGEREVQVELLELSLAPGDLYLLCSDGLTAMVPDDQIRGRLATGGSPESICRGLVHDANSNGGRDNITVLVLVVEEREEKI